MASVSKQSNTHSTTWRVKWRQDGKQTSASFETKEGADRFKANIDQFGPVEAIRIQAAEDELSKTLTVTEYLGEYIDGLTGNQPATVNRYKSYLSRDITPSFGSLPLTAVTEDTIGRWVQKMAKPVKVEVDGKTVLKTPARKTIQNKHAFLSGAFKAAVKKGLMLSNPCDGRRLPETAVTEKVFLTPEEFALLRDKLPTQRWKDFATFLVLTGLRFSEATALTPDDIDVVKKTCRVYKAWKYSTARKDLVIGRPKTKKGVRTISLPDAALQVLDLSQPEWLFTNNAGSPVRAQEFYNLAWKPARDAAMEAGLKKRPRVHDLRHTHVSWLIEDHVPLPVIQQRLGHESIKTTVDVYGHLDQRSDQAAAMILDDKIRTVPQAQIE